ncbi:MAG: transcription-repair coupling factor [Pseudomonadota bacterium]
MLEIKNLDSAFEVGRSTVLTNVASGLESLVLSEICGKANAKKGVVHVCANPQQVAGIMDNVSFFAPWLDVVSLPAWDCLPYDRVSPSTHVIADRIEALSKICTAGKDGKPLLVVTTANALLQKNISAQVVKGQQTRFTPGNRVDMDSLINRLVGEGFDRTSTVREKGEFAVRGGILDLFVPGDEQPLRLDFFGDTLESIRNFDPVTQRTTSQRQSLLLQPMSEISLTGEMIQRFRAGYLEMFGAATRDDALYKAVSENRRFAGMEHWLPLFYQDLETVFEYAKDFQFTYAIDLPEALNGRDEQIKDHYEARLQSIDQKIEGGTPYKPVPPDLLYLGYAEALELLKEYDAIAISPFDQPETRETQAIDLKGRVGKNFAAERSAGLNVFDAVANHVKSLLSENKKVLFAAWTEGSGDRISQVLEEHGLGSMSKVENFGEFKASTSANPHIAVLPVESGFETTDVVVLAEQDILGDRLVRKSGRKRKDKDFVSEASSLAEGDIVVHVDHGIARFAGLRTIEAAGAPHDCLELRYAGEDKLFLPVENIELLSRYGSSDTEVVLDKLGGVAWQARKAKLKKRLLEMADQLIKIAAERALKSSERIVPPAGLYDEFAARFPYEETEDQLRAIEAVFEDLGSGKPMDRLICGDVGFGKTEVALRAAFIAVMAGTQVAVVVPTTLLARQHFKTFSERFKGLPVNIRHASRLVGSKELAATKAGLTDGTVDIVVGTHALLGSSIHFDRLGLLVIDEEQRFGVKHKERLKELKSDVHVLTLSATPIPRTLQLALTGVRELSLITTAPVDRMAVRTFITPFDTLTVREALLRERYRGGQSFYVCPRVSDIEERRRFLEEQVPELKVAVAHGQMAPGELDDVMNAFYDGQYDVLLSTTIVESGLDIPTANTLIVHRSDMFGLAQLYQLRGRVGRSKTRAYAIFTLPVNKSLTPTAERRLRVLQSLNAIGAGFELASHDLDIRGSGNLLGEEQSGQIREVGYELYQQMLEEAVAELREGDHFVADEKWSPQIAIGTAVLIPESYVPDLQVRLGLYRRLSGIRDAEEIDAFGAEMIDRFGPMPEEMDYLLKIVFIKGLCMTANVEKLDAGPKGAVISFRHNNFPAATQLVSWLGEQGSLAKIRPDQSIFLSRDWGSAEKRLKGSAVILSKLAGFVKELDKAA